MLYTCTCDRTAARPATLQRNNNTPADFFTTGTFVFRRWLACSRLHFCLPHRAVDSCVVCSVECAVLTNELAFVWWTATCLLVHYWLVRVAPTLVRHVLVPGRRSMIGSRQRRVHISLSEEANGRCTVQEHARDIDVESSVAWVDFELIAALKSR